MLREIIPTSRWITVVLLLGLLGLIVYGAMNRDPATIVIILALVVFFALPVALVYTMNRRARMDQRQSPNDRSEDPSTER